MWLDGDPAFPAPPESRCAPGARNVHWRAHFYAANIISMPDKWEYPWCARAVVLCVRAAGAGCCCCERGCPAVYRFAAWDLAFHCVAFAAVDAEFAKRQLLLMTKEWFMHPSGQMAAYEYNFGDVNPPVHAWACLRVFKIASKVTGVADTLFLEKCFHKLLLNFTWWVNRKDAAGNNIFEGGFLGALALPRVAGHAIVWLQHARARVAWAGLDNIGVFDRSAPELTSVNLEQADGTAWMGHFALSMLAIALELAGNHGLKACARRLR